MDFIEALGQHKAYHLNKTNLYYHFACVPVIMWAMGALFALRDFHIAGFHFDGM